MYNFVSLYSVTNPKSMESIIRTASINLLKEDVYTVPQDTFGVFICKTGKAEMSIGEKVYLIEANVIVIYVPFTVIRVLNYSADWDGLMLEADIDFVFSTITNVPVSKRQAVRTMPCVKTRKEHYDRLCQLTTAIDERNRLSAAIQQSEQTAILHDIIQKLSQALCLELIAIYLECTPIEDLPLSKADQIYNRFITSVFRHCATERTVAYYAAEQNLSPGHFSVIIREQSGQTALKWIETVTLSQIKQYLRKTQWSLKEIAEKMNFAEQSAFGRFFKQHEGMSPSEFRKRTFEGKAS